MKIPFNKPYFSGRETDYIRQAVELGKIAGDGVFTEKCHRFFEENFGFRKALLTTSCTDALEMAAILCDIRQGDEVIVPSYTFVSTANAFVRQGAKVIFVDSEQRTPNMDASKVEALVTSRTKAIVPVHYAGMACDMDSIMDIANRQGLFVIEDAAQAIDSFYKGRRLGSIGHLSTFSFHETKNIICGEGGMLVVNDEQFIRRAEIIREKGTDRSAFFRGEVDKYGWVDVGSSFLPSDIIAAFLFAQVENLDKIQTRRKSLWRYYFGLLRQLDEKGLVQLPQTPEYATNNAHMFYLICNSINERDALIRHLKEHGIMAVFHYQSLHNSLFYKEQADGREMVNADRYTNCIVRLPLYYELSEQQIKSIADLVIGFFKNRVRVF
jgi:dTDP-4-amino-4,6-dideoxygalactose transaminase